MNAIIGGDKPVNTRQATPAPALVDPRSFIVGFRDQSDVVVERVLRGDDTSDLDELVTNFVLVLRGIGLLVDLEINEDGNFVIVDQGVEVDEQLELELENPLGVGDRVVVTDGYWNEELIGKIGTIVEEDGDGIPLVSYDGCTTGHGPNNAQWWTNARYLKRVTHH